MELFVCVHCGRFSVAADAKPRLFGSAPTDAQVSQKDRIRLAWLTRAENDKGSEVDFTAENLDRLIAAAPPRLTPPRAAEALLLWVAEQAEQLGAGTAVQVDLPNFTRHRADSPADLGHLINLMDESGWVRRSGQGLHLKPAGWDRAEALREIREARKAPPSTRGAWLAILPGDRDDLLPLSRKAAFERDVLQAIREASLEEPLALIATDVDHFKAVNDTHGHPAGDEVLIAVGTLHEIVARGRGKGYRVGGEELAILLRNETADEARALADRLRRSVEGHVVPAIGRSVTLSAGIAVVSDPEAPAERLKKEADQALYRAKENGRNRVEVHDPSADAPVAAQPAKPGQPTASPAELRDLLDGRPPDIPPEAFAMIRRKCESEWPDDFRMRHHCETKQVEAYRQLYASASTRALMGPEAAGLLEAAAKSGELFVMEADQTEDWIRAGATDFRDASDPAFAARHLDALQQLVKEGLARQDSQRRFMLTGRGFDLARARDLHQAFGPTETASERSRAFRSDRINRIVAGETPVPVYGGAKSILHLIPLSAFAGGAGIDVAWLDKNRSQLSPLPGSGWDGRLNFDGFIGYSSSSSSTSADESGCYVQVFRSGVIERVGDEYLKPRSSGERYIYPGFERIFLDQVPRLLGIQKELGVEPPILCMLTLVGVKGYTLWPDPARFFTRLHAVDRDILVVPEIVIEDFNIDTPRVLKPIFDPVWQAMGFAGSINYDESGNRSEA